MPYQKVTVTEPNIESLNKAFAAIRAEHECVVEFTEDIQAHLQPLIEHPPLPQQDALHIPFVTIDPASSTDLDQAIYMEREDQGYKVYYAIADVPAFVELDSALDIETRKRGQTIYTPDIHVPLHPPILGENVVSLLPEQVRGAYVWTFSLNEHAEVISTELHRAKIKSRVKLSYEEVQKNIDAGTAEESLALLKEIGMKRLELEKARGGVSLAVPTQEVRQENEQYLLNFRPAIEAERWNAQISLMTGMEAAKIMLEGKVGILRTMPEPVPESIERFKKITNALEKPWEDTVRYGDYLRSLDTEDSQQLAIMFAASSLFRGAAYTAFDGAEPEIKTQSAVAAAYAHTTAPLRRLVDRFVLPLCEAIKNGQEVPPGIRAVLPALPELMRHADHIAAKINKSCINAVEACVLASSVGQEFEATVVSMSDGGKNGIIHVKNPAIEANCTGPLQDGEHIKAILEKADITTYTVKFKAKIP